MLEIRLRILKTAYQSQFWVQMKNTNWTAPYKTQWKNLEQTQTNNKKWFRKPSKCWTNKRWWQLCFTNLWCNKALDTKKTFLTWGNKNCIWKIKLTWLKLWTLINNKIISRNIIVKKSKIIIAIRGNIKMWEIWFLNNKLAFEIIFWFIN